MKSRTDKAVREALGDFLGILEYKVRHGIINIDDVRAILSTIEASGGVRATVKDLAGSQSRGRSRRWRTPRSNSRRRYPGTRMC